MILIFESDEPTRSSELILLYFCSIITSFRVMYIIFYRTKFTSSFLEHTNWVRCARWSPDGKLIASCSDDKESCHLHHRRKERPSIKQIYISVNFFISRIYIMMCIWQTVKVWDENSGQVVHTFNEPKGFGHHLAFHPSGSCVGRVITFIQVLRLLCR